MNCNRTRDVAQKIEALALHDTDEPVEVYYGNDVLSQVERLMAESDFHGAKTLMYPLMAQEDSSQNFQWSLKYAQILEELGELHEAEEWYQVAHNLDPDYPDCHYHLGLVCDKQGRTQQALMYMERATVLRPDNEVYRNKYNEMVRNQQNKTQTNTYSLFGGNALFGGSPLFGGGGAQSPGYGLFGSPTRRNLSPEFTSQTSPGNRFYADLERQHSERTESNEHEVSKHESSVSRSHDSHRGQHRHFKWDDMQTTEENAHVGLMSRDEEEDEDLSMELNMNSKPVEFEDVEDVSDVNYHSHLFATPSTDITHSHHHRHVHIHQHLVSRTASSAAPDDLQSREIAEPDREGSVNANAIAPNANDATPFDEEKQYPLSNLNGIADDLFREVRGPHDLMTAKDQDEKTVEQSQHQFYCEKQRRQEFRSFLEEKVSFTKQHFDSYFKRFVDDGLADIRMLPYLDEATLSSIGMSKPHQKLMMQKMGDFDRESRRFSGIFAVCCVPTKVINILHDFGICTVQSFVRNFRAKSDFKCLVDNIINDAMISAIWTAIHNAKRSESSDYKRYDADSNMQSPEGNGTNYPML